MPPDTLNLIEQALTTLWLLGAFALAARLVHEKLHRVYPFFFVWLAAEILRAIAFLLIILLIKSRTLFAWTYVFTEPVIWILYFLIVWELYSLVLRNHPGIAVTGKRMMMLTMAVALVLAVLSMQPDLSRPNAQFPILQAVHVAGRAVTSTLGIFLLLVTAVLMWFPLPLNRNTIYYCVGYAVFFCTKAAMLLLRIAMGPEIVQYASIVNLLVANSCILFWAFRLQRSGEALSRQLDRRWNSVEAARLMSQLNTINEALLRTARKR